MANELSTPYATGRTVYAFLLAQGLAYTGASGAARTSGNWASLAIACTESPAGSGTYQASVPVGLPSGNYGVLFYDAADGSAVMGDDCVSVGALEYDGTEEVSLASRAPSATALSTAVWTSAIAANLDAPVSGVPAGVWANGSRTLSSFGFTVTAEVGSYASGMDPASLLLVNPSDKLLTVSGGYIQLDMTQAVPLRTQQANTAPTTADALQGAWCEAYAAEVEVPTDAPPEYIKYMPDGSTAARTFTLTVDSNGNPLGRS